MKINWKTLLTSVILGAIVSLLMGYWVYYALRGFPSPEYLTIALGLILFCSTTFWSYQAIETYKKKK